MTIPPDASGPPYPEWPAPDPRKPQERDEKGRMKKGSSGNYKGRPPTPVRALTTRELNREVIAESERLVEVNGEKLTVIQVMLRQISHASMKGDRHAQERFWSFYMGAVQAARSLNQEENRYLEFLEKYAITLGPKLDPKVQKMLNEARMKAKKL